MTDTPTSAAPPHLPRPATGPLTLQQSLYLDAAASALTGVVSLVASGVLADPLGIPRGWLVGLGAFMLVYGLDVGLVGRMLPRSRRLVPAVVVANVGWVAASVGVVVLGGFDLTALGTAVVLAQAAVVAAFAVLQRRATPAG